MEEHPAKARSRALRSDPSRRRSLRRGGLLLAAVGGVLFASSALALDWLFGLGLHDLPGAAGWYAFASPVCALACVGMVLAGLCARDLDSLPHLTVIICVGMVHVGLTRDAWQRIGWLEQQALARADHPEAEDRPAARLVSLLQAGTTAHQQRGRNRHEQR